MTKTRTPRRTTRLLFGLLAAAGLTVVVAAPATATTMSGTVVSAIEAQRAASPPYGTLSCGYNVGFGGSGRWYRNCTGTEQNVGGFPFQGLWCVPAYSYRELSAFTFGVQIVSNDCSNPPTDH